MPEFPPPDEERLKHLIFEAHEFMPGPDMARLSALEERLNRKAGLYKQRRPSRLAWWLILLLTGGAATAAWWSLGSLPDKDTESPEISIEAQSGTEPAQDKHDVQQPRREPVQSEPEDHPESPVIYRREEH